MLRSEPPGIPRSRRLLFLLLLPPLLLLLLLLLRLGCRCLLLGGGRSGWLGAFGSAAAAAHAQQTPEPRPPSCLRLLCCWLAGLLLHTRLHFRCCCFLGRLRLRRCLHSLLPLPLTHAFCGVALSNCTAVCSSCCRGRSEQCLALPRGHQEPQQVCCKAVLPNPKRRLHQLERRLLRQGAALNALYDDQAAGRALQGASRGSKPGHQQRHGRVGTARQGQQEQGRQCCLRAAQPDYSTQPSPKLACSWSARIRP